MQFEEALNSENFHILKPGKALNKTFLKVPNRSQIEWFEGYLIELLDRNNVTESDEFQKNPVINFLKKTYESNHFIKIIKSEIKHLFYWLYGLTDEEIAITEL